MDYETVTSLKKFIGWAVFLSILYFFGGIAASVWIASLIARYMGWL